MSVPAATIQIIEDSANIRKWRSASWKIKDTACCLQRMAGPAYCWPVMDGGEAMRRLKEDPATRAIPVIMMTVARSQGESDVPITVGQVVHIIKPYDHNDLLEKIRMALSMAGRPFMAPGDPGSRSS